MANVADFNQEVEVKNDFVTHPAGHEGIFKVTKGAEKIEREKQIVAVEFTGSVDGSNVREYISLILNDEGEWSSEWKATQALTAFRLRKHGGGKVAPVHLMSITAGKTAKASLRCRAYGKCASCGQSVNCKETLKDEPLTGGTVPTECRCGGLIERRLKNEVLRWLEPDAELSKQAQATKAEGGNNADAWG